MPNQPTTLANGRLEWAADVLRTIGVANPSREIREIMASVLAVPRDEVWGLRDRIEHARISEAFAVAVERRRDGEPLEYVTGRCGFRHLDLTVDRHTLIPRPETEGLVEAVLEYGRSRAGTWGRVLDLGTGSGCIALSLAHEGAFAEVVATDISEPALQVARTNATDLDLRIDFRAGSWFAPIHDERFAVIVSNPPYITLADYEGLNPSVQHFEPRIALESGEQGMDAVTAILAGAARYMEPGGLLALEIDSQHEAQTLAAAIAAGWSNADIERDVFDRPRYLIAIKEF